MKRVISSARSLGVIILALAVVTAVVNQWFAGSLFSFWSVVLVIIGAALLVAPASYAREQLDLFTSSFTRWKTILLTGLVYDIALILLISSGGLLYELTLTSTVNDIKSGMTMNKEIFTSPELTAQGAQHLQSLVFTFAVGFALFLLFGLCVYALFRYLSWSTVAGQQFTRKSLLKFLGLNALWWLFWIVVMAVVGSAVIRDPNGRIVLVVLLFIAGYFTLFVHALFAKTNRIGYSLSNGVSFGIGKIHRLLIPASLALVVFYILRFGVFYLIYLLPIAIVGEVIKALLLILCLAWLRVYFYSIISELPKHEV